MIETPWSVEKNPAAVLARIVEALTDSLSPKREPQATTVGLIKETERGEFVINQQKWRVLKDASLFKNAVDRLANTLVRRAYDDGNTFTTPQRYIISTWAGESGEEVIDRQTFMVIPGQLPSQSLETVGPGGLAVQSFEQQLAVESMRLMVQESSEANRAMMAMYRNEIEDLRRTVAKRDETIEKLYITLANLQEKSGMTQERLSTTIVNTQEKTVGVIDRHITAIEQHRDGSIERELRIKREMERGGMEDKAWGYFMEILPQMAKHVLGGGGAPAFNNPSAVVGWLKSLSPEQTNAIDAFVGSLPEDKQALYYEALKSDITNGSH